MIAYYIINANGWYYNFELGRFTGRWCEKDCAKTDKREINLTARRLKEEGWNPKIMDYERRR